MSTDLTTVRNTDERLNRVDMTQHGLGNGQTSVSLQQRNRFTHDWNTVELDRAGAVAMVAALTEWLANGSQNFNGHED